MDNIIDNNISRILRLFSPTYIGLLVFYYYNVISDYTNPYLSQLNRTIDAGRSSFKCIGTYCFYDEIPVPIYLESLKDNNKENSEKIRWYYISDKNLFVENLNELTSISVKKRISWLSAEINYNGVNIVDISNFIEDISYVSSDGLPPSPTILVGLWAYNNGFLPRRSDTTLVVISSEDAETYSFNFADNYQQNAEWRKSLGF